MNKYAQYSKANKKRSRDVRTFRHCGRKVLFTKEAAMQRANEINAAEGTRKMIAYNCHFCGPNGWHLKRYKGKGIK